METADRIGWSPAEPEGALLTREWLVTNGLGGYASGSLGGASTRRFHGVLVAALGAPYGRTMILNRLDEEIVLPGGTATPLEGLELLEGPSRLPAPLSQVRFESGLPVWRYEVGGAVLEKRVVMPHGQNTTYVIWRLVKSPAPITLRVRPALHVRPHEGNLALNSTEAYAVRGADDGWVIAPGSGLPPIRLRFVGGSASSLLDGHATAELMYRVERDRGYDYRGALFTPGVFELTLAEGAEVAAVVTVETDSRPLAAPGVVWDSEIARRTALVAAADPSLREGMGPDLVLAADAFVIRPALRDGESELAATEGQKARTVIAGYHWFTDWGRDTMISLEGLALLTGRHDEAAYILKTFARHVKDGLIPNMFPEGKNEGVYHTADATLWFFHALDRYVAHTGDRDTLRDLLPTMLDIVQRHVDGTRFGIGVDPRDDLLSQGAPGYQLTWMDAKVDDWVVTPRRGKAVEINALWFNALSVAARWVKEEGGPGDAAPLVARAERVRASFNGRFWYEKGAHLYDVIDGEQGDDPSLRPNQIFAMALPNPVLDPSRWARVLDVVRASLLTPVGLRSLAPGERDYKKKYDGDLRARDAAYHEGTVWGWLAGPFVDAWLRVWPDDVAGARRIVEDFAPHLREACIGSISEIFDAEPPYTPRGCVAQAWSVAEVLRAWVRTGRTGRTAPTR